ncbi:MAG: class I SAM-dependent DNA methyltransferase [Bacteroidota bacterium]
MGVPFDHIASTYDSVFTRSAIGQLQRKQVWRYVEKIMPQLNGFDMLELNCGTGEDAMLFSERGFNIVATDISEEMLKVTQQKARQFSMQHRISSHYLDLDSFSEMTFDKKFDLIFSNFGGLNCIHPESLKKLLDSIPSILKPGGRFIGVIMPRFCAWETFYFLSKFQFKNAFRRWTRSEVITNLHGVTLKTWYYNPATVKRMVSSQFKIMAIKPIGIALPPSYLETFFLKRKRWLLRLHTLEKRMDNISLFSGISDHFVFDLKLK